MEFGINLPHSATFPRKIARGSGEGPRVTRRTGRRTHAVGAGTRRSAYHNPIAS